MLRMLVLAGLILGVCDVASAQSVQSATITQTNANNYALIAPGNVSTEITVQQSGGNNTAVLDQTGPINAADVDQRAKNSNNSYVDQVGPINVAIVTQEYNFGAIIGATPGYSAQQTNVGYLSEFNSGGVSILTLTGPGSTLVSSFGRTH
jgi:hypothetical protein